MRNKWILKWDWRNGEWIGTKKEKDVNNYRIRLQVCYEGLIDLGFPEIHYDERKGKKVAFKVTKKKHEGSVIVWVRVEEYNTVSYTIKRLNRDNPTSGFTCPMECWILKHFPEIQDNEIHKYYVSATLLD